MQEQSPTSRTTSRSQAQQVDRKVAAGTELEIKVGKWVFGFIPEGDPPTFQCVHGVVTACEVNPKAKPGALSGMVKLGDFPAPLDTAWVFGSFDEMRNGLLDLLNGLLGSLKQAKRQAKKRPRPGELAQYSGLIGHYKREVAKARGVLAAQVEIVPGGEEKALSLSRYEASKKVAEAGKQTGIITPPTPRTDSGRKKATPTQLGNRIKVFMDANSMKQTDLVEKTGLTRHVVSRIVRGIVTNPDDETLNAIADALGLGLGEKAKLKALRED